MAALPFVHASESGVTPKSLVTSTWARARISRSAVSRSSQWAAQCSAVAPSGCARFTSIFCASKARAAARSRFLTASTSRRSVAAAATLATNTRGHIHRPTAFGASTTIFVASLLATREHV